MVLVNSSVNQSRLLETLPTGRAIRNMHAQLGRLRESGCESLFVFRPAGACRSPHLPSISECYAALFVALVQEKPLNYV